MRTENFISARVSVKWRRGCNAVALNSHVRASELTGTQSWRVGENMEDRFCQQTIMLSQLYSSNMAE